MRNPFRKSSVVTAVHEQTNPAELRDTELTRL